MNAKICLPDGERGFAVAKVVQEADLSNSIMLSLDPSLLGEKLGVLQGAAKWNSAVLTSHDNLSKLPKGTAILLAPPSTFGVKFWIARIGKLNGAVGNGKDKISENIVQFKLSELKKLKNFLEARSSQRVVFRTPVLQIEPKSYTVTQYFSHDISRNGLSLSLDLSSLQEGKAQDNFEVGENYLLQLKLHEGMSLPALNYCCVHKREDVITGAKLIGFELDDRRAQEPEVEYNLTLLTWSTPSEEPQG